MCDKFEKVDYESSVNEQHMGIIATILLDSKLNQIRQINNYIQTGGDITQFKSFIDTFLELE